MNNLVWGFDDLIVGIRRQLVGMGVQTSKVEEYVESVRGDYKIYKDLRGREPCRRDEAIAVTGIMLACCLVDGDMIPVASTTHKDVEEWEWQAIL